MGVQVCDKRLTGFLGGLSGNAGAMVCTPFNFLGVETCKRLSKGKNMTRELCNRLYL